MIRILIVISLGFLIHPSQSRAGDSEADPGGSTHTLEVEPRGETPWVVESLVPWITILGPGAGTGAGTVTYRVSSNDSAMARTGRLRTSYENEESPRWIIATVDDEGTVGTESSLSFGPQGQPAISYFDAGSGSLKYASFNGITWSSEIVDPADGAGNHSSLAHAPDGSPCISYQDQTRGTLKFASFREGAWNIETVSEDSNVGGHGTSLSFGPNGKPAISCFDPRNTALRVYELVGLPGEEFWRVELVDTGREECTNSFPPRCWDISSRGQYSSLGHRPDGTITISYVDTTYREVFFAEPNSGAGLFQDRWLKWRVDQRAEVAAFTSMAYDPQGRPGIGYATTSGLTFAFFAGERLVGAPVWEFQQVEEGNVGDHLALSFDAGGQPGMSYFDRDSADLKYACRSGDLWIVETIDREGHVGEYTSIDHGLDGFPAISYHDSSNGALKCARMTRASSTLYHTVIQAPTNPPAAEITFEGLVQRCSGFPLEVLASSTEGASVELDYYAVTPEELVLLDAPPVDPGSYRVVASTLDGTRTAVETMVIEPPFLASGSNPGGGNHCEPVTCTEWLCSGREALNRFSIGIAPGTPWRVTSSVPWITFEGATSGTGPATLFARMSDNRSRAAREGGIRLSYPAGEIIWLWEQHTFRQEPIDPDLDTDGDGLKDLVETNTGVFDSATDTGTDPLAADSDGDGFLDFDEVAALTDPTDPESVPTSLSEVTSAGESGAFPIAAGEGVSWTATSQAPWIHLTGPASGIGPGTVAFTVDPDEAERVRDGWISVTLTDPNQAVEGWNLMTVDNGANVGWWDTSISHGPDGLPAISYYDNTDDDLKYAVFNGERWSSQTIDEGGSVGRFNAISHGPDGYPAIAYYDWTNRDLKYASFDGVQWNIEVVESDEMIGTEVSLSHGPAGNPAISYHNVSSRDLKFASHDGVSWTTTTIASTGDVGRYGTSLSHDPDGHAAISYYDNTKDDLMFASHDGENWVITTVDSGGNVGRDSSLSYNPGGHPVISYYDYSNRDLKLATYDGNRWRLETIDAEGVVGQHTSLSHAPDGHPAISYYDSSNDNLKFASFDGFEWKVETVDGEGFVGQYTSLSHAQDGGVVISYYDNTNDSLKAARREESTGGTTSTVHTVIQRPAPEVPDPGPLPVSGFDIRLVTTGGGPAAAIAFPTVRGVQYSVEYSVDLRNWIFLESLNGTGGVMEAVRPGEEEELYFRILARQ